MSEDAVIGLLVATVQFATLVYLAGLGELIAERSGVLNLGVEGMMAMGAVSGIHGGDRHRPAHGSASRSRRWWAWRLAGMSMRSSA